MPDKGEHLGTAPPINPGAGPDELEGPHRGQPHVTRSTSTGKLRAAINAHKITPRPDHIDPDQGRSSSSQAIGHRSSAMRPASVILRRRTARLRGSCVSGPLASPAPIRSSRTSSVKAKEMQHLIRVPIPGFSEHLKGAAVIGRKLWHAARIAQRDRPPIRHLPGTRKVMLSLAQPIPAAATGPMRQRPSLTGLQVAWSYRRTRPSP